MGGTVQRALHCLVVVGLCRAALVVSPARGQDTATRFIATGTVACADQEAADDVIAVIHDSDAEAVVQQLMLLLSSGGCSDRLAGEGYELMEVESSGIIKARVRGFATVYLVPLAPIRTPPPDGQAIADVQVFR